ncbi:MAG TPA: hypothetical protein VHA07_02000 [Devosia sp.]|nr:hypothetical protein [Devosia sp.]
MRALLVLLLTLAASPALAQASIADQAQAAYAVFAGGLSQQDFLAAHYGDKLFDDIAGNWVRLNGPQDKTGIETYGADTERFCKSPAALTLASDNPLSLTLATNLKGRNFTQTYTLIAGATFGEHTDPWSYLEAVGIGADKTGDAADQQRALLLSLANGLVQIYRPSPDILVMTRDRGYPIVLARCPAAAPPSGPRPPASATSSSSSAEH